MMTEPVQTQTTRPEDSPEHRLSASRERIRTRLQPRSQSTGQPSGQGTMSGSLLNQIIRPVAGDMMRDHPFLALGGAAAAGAALVWWKPWRVAGPVIVSLLAKNASAASVALAMKGLNRLWASPGGGREQP